MASSIFFFLLFITFSYFPHSTALSSEAIFDAADVLADSGFVSMALTLEVIAESFLSHSPSATVFAPSDSAFRKSGQPSFDLLRFHFVPLPLPPQTLRLLTTGAMIPTMLPGKSLIVTASSSDRKTSINNIKITESPIYDDGFLLIYATERFFDPNFQFNGPNQRSNNNPSCVAKNYTANSSDSFDQAIETLKSGGFSAMASFLGTQLSGVSEQSGITVFAPADNMVLNRIGDLSELPWFFRRHVVPCKLLWNDLVNFDDESELPTFLEGFTINITRNGGVLVLNGVQVFYPDIFFNDKVAVHGVSDALTAQ
ncbi:hypothetical protein Lal_00000437 [Lupinus albus]|uniref:Putative FAS1 domain-containing protein n=1 Tax=Lupinus albus TaxID=3870 RepID=A0A6A5LH85_LUPAL|nr:putative FAS1 domain-containing protein [Lupinus albus]KAF1861021.1 hypothetical protein Lal_00000437 [Lupinus albus]